MSKLISFDYAIKYLLKDKGDHDIIEGFISAILKEQGYKAVKIIAILDCESNKEQYSQKKSLADLIVEDEDHKKYIVEIERQEVKNFISKACFNTSRLIVDQISSGNSYLDIKKVFHISLLYFELGDEPLYHGKTVVSGMNSNQKLSIQIEDKSKNIYDATDVFPEYIFISIPSFDNRIEREIHEWLYVLKNEDVKPEFASPYMQKVSDRLSVLKMSIDDRNAYTKYIKDVATYKDAINTAEKKGREEGKKEGLAQGIQKGKKEEKLQIAKNMLVLGMSVSQVSSATGLGADEVKKLD